MEDSNRLIAEFMGMQDTDLGWYDSEEAMSEYACQMVGGGNAFEVLQYDRSWDWLMPVMNKCKAYSLDNTYLDRINEVLMETEIDQSELYKAVVDFIKWYNEKQQSNEQTDK